MEKDFNERLRKFKQAENERLSKMNDDEIYEFMKMRHNQALEIAKKEGMKITRPTRGDK